MSNGYHLAQFNIGKMRAPLEDPLMAGFTALLDEVNALADRSPGFVWRFQTEAGNATAVRPYDDDLIIFNFSVWESVEQFKAYAYRGAHGDVLRRRHEWFEKFAGVYQVMWWVEAGRIPSLAEAKERLDHLRRCGESEYAFSLKQIFPPTSPCG